MELSSKVDMQINSFFDTLSLKKCPKVNGKDLIKYIMHLLFRIYDFKEKFREKKMIFKIE